MRLVDRQSLPIEERNGNIELWVLVQPRASCAAIAGIRQDALLIWVTAPPVEGEANQALRTLLASSLNVPVKNIVIVRGERQRRKRVRIAGLTAAQFFTQLQFLLPKS